MNGRILNQFKYIVSLWEAIVYDETKDFIKRFCPYAWILYSVSWNSENMLFTYILESGQHVTDNVGIDKWLSFLKDNGRKNIMAKKGVPLRDGSGKGTRDKDSK